MTDDLDRLLRTDLLDVPPDFAEQVMAQVEYLPAPALPDASEARRVKWQWLALVGGSLVAVAQVISFMFGIWSATNAG